MKRYKQLTAFVLALMVMLVLSITALAAGDANEAVNEARRGVLQINLLYVDQSGNEHLLQGGSGFLIGETSGADHIITNAHVINMDDQTRLAAGEIFGVDFFSGNVNLKVKVVVKRDVEINAAIVNQSNTMDFAILKLEQPIYDREPLKLNSNMNSVVATSNVYALGFPAAIELAQDATYYTSDDVSVTAGIVSKTTFLDSVGYIQHSATLSESNSGGPLVNGNGEVIGLNRVSEDDTYFYSMQISEVTEILNMLGIQYVEVGESDSAVQEPVQAAASQGTSTEAPAVSNETETVDKTALSNELAAALAIDISKYSGESAIALSSAIANSNTVLADSAATQAEVDSALTMLQNAQSSMVEKSDANMMIVVIIVAAVAVMLILVIILIAVLSGSGKKSAPVSASRTIYGGGVSQPFHPMGMSSEGAGETSVLNDGGVGETSVLSGGVMNVSASLTRIKTGEHISISRQVFKIGKERAKVDYCIPDNNSISRHHASIVNKGGMFYLVDMKSTNYTFVNGNKVIPELENKLNNGDRFKLADEEFEFSC